MKKIILGILITLVIVVVLVISLIVFVFNSVKDGNFLEKLLNILPNSEVITEDVKLNPSDKKELVLGRHVFFGNYNGKPIQWKVIDIDAEGDLMLFSDFILCFKAFSANDGIKRDINEVNNTTSNYWPEATIRQWLNSNEDRIKWTGYEPIKNGVWSNPYNNESGFLSLKNFLKSEIEIIKPYTHKVLLANDYISKKDGGGEHEYYGIQVISDVENNYDSSIYKNTVDKVFLLSTVEVKRLLWDKKIEYRRKPTQDAVDTNEDKSDYCKSSLYHDYWLCTPMSLSYLAYIITERESSVMTKGTDDGDVGVCPAIFIKKDKVSIKDGLGTMKNPYMLNITEEKK